MKQFIGFYDKNGKPLHVGDRVKATKTHSTRIYSSNGRDIPEEWYFEIRQSAREPSIYLSDLEPVVQRKKPIPDSYRHTLLPNFEAYPKNMFWTDDRGKMANSYHYAKIAHLPEEVRYKSMPDIELANQEET